MNFITILRKHLHFLGRHLAVTCLVAGFSVATHAAPRAKKLEVQSALQFPLYTPGEKLVGFYPLYKLGGHLRLFKSGERLTPVQIYNAKGNLDAQVFKTWGAQPKCQIKQKTKVCYSISASNGTFSLHMGAQEQPGATKIISAEKLISRADAEALVSQFHFAQNSKRGVR